MAISWQQHCDRPRRQMIQQWMPVPQECVIYNPTDYFIALVQMLDKRIITCCLVFSVIGGQVLAFLLTTHQNANELVVAALCGVAMKTGKSSALKRYEAIRLFGR